MCLTKKSIFFKILTQNPSVALKIESVIRRTIVEPPPSLRVSHTLSSIQYLYSNLILIPFVKLTHVFMDCGNASV